MYRYIAMNAAFLMATYWIVAVLRAKLRLSRVVSTSAVLLVMMLVFDSYLTSLPIVLYNSQHILGVRFGTIPVEDFAYLLAVVILAPSLYSFFSKRADQHE